MSSLALPSAGGSLPPRAGPSVAILAAESLPPDATEAVAILDKLTAARFQVVMVGTSADGMADGITRRADAWLPSPPEEIPLITAIQSALRTAALRQELEQARDELSEKEIETQSLYEIGHALSAEKDIQKLEGLIIQRCRQLTRADAGTLYLLDEDAEKNRILRFEISHNDTLGPTYARFTMPLTEQSISGYVGLTGNPVNLPDVYELPEGTPYSFNRSFDDRMGYRTKSMLVVPMLNHEGVIIGVIQLLNRKRTNRKLRTREIAERVVVPFTKRDEQVLSSFAGQAAVALDNRLLLESIETMFEGFVRASVTAIEARDPTTSGHSERVGELTVGIAAAINEIGVGKWKKVRFSDQQITEIRYAGLLHDFGKIGVRENVLVKSKKLYDWQLELVRYRFGMLRKGLEAEHARKQLEYALEHGREAFMEMLAEMDAEFEREVGTLDEDLAMVVGANEPTVLAEEGSARLLDIGGRQYHDLDGSEKPLLDENELIALSVKRGSLTEAERKEIESHVAHTYKFLSIMPWTRHLKGVPLIAGAHHEKLDGTGYPRGLKADEIPVQSKMMTISDIYDALTASDRPYKRAVPIPKALDILVDEVRVGHVDKELLDVFIEKKVYEIAHKGQEPQPS